jgi:hypothetical protein
MFFAFSDRVRTGVREYRAGETVSIHYANEVSSNLGDYLPAHLRSLYADRQTSMVMALPEDGHAVYVYQFLTQDEQRVVSAWYRLLFPKITISDMHSIDGHFYILGWWENGLGLYKLEKPGTIFLDYQTQGVVDADGKIDLTTWAFKDCTQDEIEAIVMTGQYAGLQIQIESFNAGIIQLKEVHLFEGETVIVGLTYESKYVPTMPVLRDKEGKARQLDRLQVNFVEVTVANTKSFLVRMSAPYYEDTIQYFSGMNVGSSFVAGVRPVSARKEYI